MFVTLKKVDYICSGQYLITDIYEKDTFDGNDHLCSSYNDWL